MIQPVEASKSPWVVGSFTLPAAGPDELPPSPSQTPTRARIVAVGLGMRESLAAVVAAVCGVPREKALIERCGIDRSTAGKVVRALRTDSPDAFLIDAPSPEGLRLVLAGAARAGCDTDLVARAEAAVLAWHDVIERYPGKRRGLATMLASASSDNREKADLISRRSMFQHASEFLGYRLRHSVATMMVTPGADGRLNTLHVVSKYGLERTRSDGGPITVMGVRAGPAAPECRFFPIDPSDRGDRAEDCVLKKYTKGLRTIELVRTPANAIELRLPTDEPGLNQPLDLVCGQRIPGLLLSNRQNGAEYEWYQALPRIPTRTMTLDLILHDQCYPGMVPIVDASLFGPGSPLPPSAGTMISDHVRHGAKVEMLERGLRSIGLEDCPEYADMIREVAAQAALDPRTMRTVRTTVKYPMLMAAIVLWIPLAP